MPHESSALSPITSAWSPRFAREGESLWSIIHKFTVFNGFKGPRCRRLLDVDTTLTECTRHQHLGKRLRGALNLDDQISFDATAQHYVPPPILNEYSLAPVFEKKLRFCRSCLSAGYHSAVHQITYVKRCPIHHIPLETHCPTCGCDIPMTCSDTALAHAFSCRCGHQFLNAAPETGLRAAVANLDTSTIGDWLTWCKFWPEKAIYKEINSRLSINHPPLGFGGGNAVHRALSALWTSKSPERWDKAWVAFEAVGEPRTIELYRSRARAGSDSDVELYPSEKERMKQRARDVVQSITKIVRASHPRCSFKDSTACPLGREVGTWVRYWIPSNELTLKYIQLAKPTAFLRMAWTVENKVRMPSSLLESFIEHLIELCMTISLAWRLKQSARHIDDDTEFTWEDWDRYDCIRMVLDTEEARLIVLEPLSEEHIALYAHALRTESCDEHVG